MRRRASGRAALLTAAVLAGGTARAEGLSATLEPRYDHIETDVTDQAGETSHQVTDLFTQNYRLSFDRALTTHLTAWAGGTFLHERGWTRLDGVESDQTGRSTSLFGRLTLATPVLTGGLGAERRLNRAFASPTSFVTERYGGYASWRPLDLPEIEARIERTNTFDDDGVVEDTISDTATLAARYRSPGSELRYLLSWNRTSDLLRQSETTEIDQTVFGTRTDTLFRGRTTTYMSGSLQTRNSSTETRGAGATVSRQRLPVMGLSAVEALPATPGDEVLSPNPALIDGNTTVSATVNVGFGPSATGDLDARAVGARFADVVTSVNTIYVWFDRGVVPDVAGALAASVKVYRSDDNRRWTAVSVVGTPVLSPVENRIEITIVQTQAQFLKATLKPLAVGVTTDPAYRDLFVTEIQLLLVLPAQSVPRSQSDLSISATGLARTVILRAPELAHDVSVTVSRQTEASRTLYSVINGLSAMQTLGAGITGNARVSRQDVDVGRGREGRLDWSAALVGRPLPTVLWSLTYAGDSTSHGEIGHSITGLGRADWWEGISSQARASGSIITEGARTARTGQAAATTSLAPNRLMTLTVGGLYNRSFVSDPVSGDVVTDFARVDGSLSLAPAPALSGVGTVSRVLLGVRRTTYGTIQVNYFPLRGDLQLSIAYSKTLDTEADATTEVLSPSLRWNVRRGVSLASSYSLLKNATPVQTLCSRAFQATLLVTI